MGSNIKNRLQRLEHTGCDRSALLPMMVTAEPEAEWTEEQRIQAEKLRRDGYTACSVDHFL